MKKFTIDIFIKNANTVHNNKYDYSLVNYVNNKTIIKIICPLHGIFEQTPTFHVNQKYGCRKCSKHTTMTIESFIEKSDKVHKNKYDYSLVDYVGHPYEAKIICPTHGEFLQRIHDHAKGGGCSKCSGTKKLTTEEFIELAKKVHNDKYDYSIVNYTSRKNNINIICKEHGAFLQQPNSHLRGYGCGKCSKTEKLTTREFIEIANTKHDFKYNYENVIYVNRRTKITIICPIHGRFEQTPDKHIDGLMGCASCGKEQRAKNVIVNKGKTFVEYCIKKHNNFYNYSKTIYTGVLNKIIVICPFHGEFKQSASNHKQGNGCGKCKKKKQYNLFLKLTNEFKNEQIVWEARPLWLCGQELDIFFSRHNIGVEYQGEQHYFPVTKYPTDGDKGVKQYLATVERDKIKRKRCINNNCKLFEVKYDHVESDFIELVKQINFAIK